MGLYRHSPSADGRREGVSQTAKGTTSTTAQAKPWKPKGPPRGVRLTAEEVVATRELLEGVMTIAAHGILYRVGQIIGDRVVADARTRAGDFRQSAIAVLAKENWIAAARVFPQKVLVYGSVEVREAPGPTCHILRGILQKVMLADAAGPGLVREEKCQSAGAESCEFVVQRGARWP